MKELRNKTGDIRVCSRCEELATTRVKSEWLGPNCLHARRQRQREQAAFVHKYCAEGCGKTIAKDQTRCLDCQTAYRQHQANMEMQIQIADATTIDDLKPILFALASKICG